MIRKLFTLLLFASTLFAISPEDQIALLKVKLDVAQAQSAVNAAVTQMLQSDAGRTFIQAQSTLNDRISVLQNKLLELSKKYNLSVEDLNADNRDPKPGPDKPVPSK